MATQDDVRAAHRRHPEWTANKIAQELHCSSGYIRRTAQRLRLKLPKENRDGVQALGEAAKAAGMTLADIEAWGRAKAERSKVKNFLFAMHETQSSQSGSGDGSAQKAAGKNGDQ
jgi:hypothetical protein